MSAALVVFLYALLTFSVWGLMRAALLVKNPGDDKTGWLTWTTERALGTFTMFMPLILVLSWMGK